MTWNEIFIMTITMRLIISTFILGTYREEKKELKSTKYIFDHVKRDRKLIGNMLKISREKG